MMRFCITFLVIKTLFLHFKDIYESLGTKQDESISRNEDSTSAKDI